MAELEKCRDYDGRVILDNRRYAMWRCKILKEPMILGHKKALTPEEKFSRSLFLVRLVRSFQFLVVGYKMERLNRYLH
jgi:hypothetical protein